ncbi:nuclear transport factor 2 family protein [Singulisphaera acidiphila]|uniref:Ketosteroid isomerase-like protein n=1 Tax=Singulisphaera acidiphila (strain ATCC BAA-1392 / DSM 18658 / VKM B-2454 / MOB10) TaxID=886293 RepID=L0DE39_SINAD|nr:nuclear transport factor 2 family protein [Singulisphaera acidiphila]AGA27649.1 ketosteroid isomerase-like protein [Singulisphaera acidiphila DSM 18658]
MSEMVIMDFANRLPQAFREGDSNAMAKDVESDNVLHLQSVYQAIAQGDLAAFADMLAEDVDLEIHGPLTVPYLGSWRGRQQVVEAVRNNFATVEEQCPELQSVIAQGDTVVASGNERGRYKATGQDYDIQWVQFHTFSEGKLIRIRQLVTNTRS